MPKPTLHTVGGTVQASGGIYIERKADQELFKLCREGAFAYVLTSRQVGKSSLMVRTAEQLGKEGVRPIIIDLTEFGIQVSAEAWYLGLLTSIADDLALQIDAVTWWRDREHFGVTQRLTKFFVEVVLAQIQDPIVIFIDEIDSTLSLPFTDDFYAAIRYLYNARSQESALRRLTFVLIGVATPSDLISDPYRTPFNIGQQVNITDFTFEEALPLAEGLCQTPEESPQVFCWVMKWTGGHPYLTQRLCRTLAEEFRSHWAEIEVDQAVAQTFFGKMSEEDNNLQFVRDMLTKRASDKLRVLEDYKEIRLSKKPVRDEEQSPIKTHLKLSGIVKRDAGKLQVRNPIYYKVFDGNWIKEHWPVRWFQTIPTYVKVISAATFFLLLTSVIGLALYVGNIQAIAERDRKLILAEQTRAEMERKRTEEAQRFAEQRGNLLDIAEKRRQETEAEKLRAESLAVAEADARGRAELQTARARREEFVADSLRIEEEKARRLADERRSDVERRRRVDIARYLATQAQQQSGNKELGALLARQAFLINRDDSGPWGNLIHNALLQTTPNQVGKITLRGHTAAIRAVAFSANGENLVSGSDDGSLRLWSRQENLWEPKQTLTGHTDRVKALAFASAALVSGSEDRTVRWWRLRQDSYEATTLGGHQNRILVLALSSDEQILATGGVDNTVLLWHPQNPNDGAFDRLEHSSWIRALAFSADGKLLAVGCDDGTIVLWKMSPDQSEKFTVLEHNSGLKSLTFHPRQRILLSGDNDGRITQWLLDKPGEKPQFWQAHNAGVNALAFSRDARLFASGSSDKNVKLWDFNKSDRDPILTFAHDGFVWSVALNPDATLLAAGCEDKQVYVWETRTAVLAEMVCQRVKRNLTREEWRTYVGPDIGYESTCANWPGDGHTSR